MTWLSKLPPSYVECRTIRHSWDIITFNVVPIAELREKMLVPRSYDQTVRREAVCIRCNTTRVEYFGRTQEVLRDFERFSVSYYYPDGYLWNGKKEEDARPTFRDANRELFRRMVR